MGQYNDKTLNLPQKLSGGLKKTVKTIQWKGPTYCGLQAFVLFVQVYNGSTRPGDASTWRAEGQRLEDHQ